MPATNRNTRRRAGAPKRAPAKVKVKRGQYVYSFDEGACVATPSKELLGGKGANLHNMVQMGLPVPPGFTVVTSVCAMFYEHKRTLPDSVWQQIRDAVAHLEAVTGKKFGNNTNPLLVSVRSGARHSMPGMMDTILNLGLNDQTVEALARVTSNGRFAWDCYRRFVQMYGDVVMGVQKKNDQDHDPFEEVLSEYKREVRVENDTDLSEAELTELVSRFKKLIKKRTGKDFPSDSMEQLRMAIGAVFGSWHNDRARVYREKYGIPEAWGTAVNVQSMVFGNMGDNSATGVAFTRDPATGENVFYGEYLVNAQGEDVVAGIRTPKPIAEMAADPQIAHAFRELQTVRAVLEQRFGDVQDFEFTIERGKLFMLQTRNGQRTAFAHMRIAHDMVRGRLMTPEHAVSSFDPETLNQLLAPVFNEVSYRAALRDGRCMTKGLPAGPGAACGVVVFSPDEAHALSLQGKRAILCRIETSPEDLRGMIAAQGILTTRGGVSSHAALVARQMGKVCVAGAGEIQIDYIKRTLTCGTTVLREGDTVSINGTTGEIFAGPIETSDSELQRVLSGDMEEKGSRIFAYYVFFMKLVDKFRRLGVRTNADTPDQVRQAIALGAEGIGLCRTEHMFFEEDRIDAVREMIVASDEHGRRAALRKLLPYQRKDFKGIFEALAGRPACIRLLDPPLHEFLPHEQKQISGLASKMGIPFETLSTRVHALHEQNPMLGFRGCRLGIVYPEITEMQATAIFEAAAAVQKHRGTVVPIEIMVPLVGSKRELDLQADVIERVRDEVSRKTGEKFSLSIGTMIELPRACVVADEIAQRAEFFSFGTNDLSQTTLGMSRDDSGSFLPVYQEKGVYESNPFASLDTRGVGSLVRLACTLGKTVRKDIKLGICGEHGGDPSSIEFFHGCGLAYVSCAPLRVPIARTAAARAALKDQSKQRAG